MVISHIFRQNIRRISCFMRVNFVEKPLLKQLSFRRSQNISMSKERKRGAYEGDGKTVGFVLNKKHSEVLLINTVMLEGFVLSSGRELIGSLILFPHSLISWHVLRAADISEESLVLFKLLEPKIDILIFGYGSRKDYTPEVQQKFTKICKKLGIRYEALPTENAVGVYNFMAEDRRLVAAALIPPTNLDVLKFERPKHIYIEGEDYEEQTVMPDDKIDKKLIK